MTLSRRCGLRFPPRRARRYQASFTPLTNSFAPWAQATRSWTTLPETSVRRKSRPWKRYGRAVVVDAAQVQHGGVQVVDVDILAVFQVAVAQFVGAAVGEPALDAAAGHPDGEAVDVMIAADALAHRRAAEFAAPDDQRVVEQAALLEVVHQGGAGLVHVPRGRRSCRFRCRCDGPRRGGRAG